MRPSYYYFEGRNSPYHNTPNQNEIKMHTYPAYNSSERTSNEFPEWKQHHRISKDYMLLPRVVPGPDNVQINTTNRLFALQKFKKKMKFQKMRRKFGKLLISKLISGASKLSLKSSSTIRKRVDTCFVIQFRQHNRIWHCEVLKMAMYNILNKFYFNRKRIAVVVTHTLLKT